MQEKKFSYQHKSRDLFERAFPARQHTPLNTTILVAFSFDSFNPPLPPELTFQIHTF